MLLSLMKRILEQLYNIMYYSVEILEEFIRNQIAKPSADTTILRSWYKYSKECPEWSHLTYGDAPGFCKLAKLAGKNINEEFGFDVALSGDGTIMAAGAYNNNSRRGDVRIYQNNSGTWNQLGSDIAGTASNTRLGREVALSEDGTIVAIGEYQNGESGGSNGAVKIYEYSGGNWGQVGASIYGLAGDKAGTGVALSADGSIVAVGASLHDSNKGTTRIYQNTGGNWNQLGSI